MIETPIEVNIVEQRKKFLEELKVKIVNSFLNRRQVTPEKEGVGFVEINQEIREKKRITDQAKLEAKVITTAPAEDEPWQVTVENSHDYLELLRMSMKIFIHYGMKKEAAEKILSWMLQHEYEHIVPALGMDLKFRWGISFFENNVTKSPAWQPYVLIDGLHSFELSDEMLKAPTELSKGDMMLLE